MQKICYSIYGLECFVVIKKSKKVVKQFSLVIANSKINDLLFMENYVYSSLIFTITQTTYFNIFLEKKNQIKKFKISFVRWLVFYTHVSNVQNKLYAVTGQFFMLKPYFVFFGEHKLLPKMDEKTLVMNTAMHIFQNTQTLQQPMVATAKKHMHYTVYLHTTFSLFKTLVNFIGVYEYQKKNTQTKKTKKSYIFLSNICWSGFFIYLLFNLLCLLFFYFFFILNLIFIAVVSK